MNLQLGNWLFWFTCVLWGGGEEFEGGGEECILLNLT